MKAQDHKEKLREELLTRRIELSSEQWSELSAKIIKRLTTLPTYKEAKWIHCYVSMNKRREVNTHTFIKQMISRGKQVIVPITHPEEGTLTHHRLSDFEDLAPNKWGVPEPADGEEVQASLLDLVIVPMVGGDKQCNRIGYGGGFYDRFLHKVQCPKVGLIFEQNILPKLPVEPFDVALDKIITENRIIKN